MHTELISQEEWIHLRARLRLSERQSQIVRLLVQGKADKQIAGEVGISVSTVRTHMDRLFRRFGLSDRVELIVYMFRCVREQTLDGHQVSGSISQSDAPAYYCGP